MTPIQEIYESLLNGQRRQMVEQIDAFGVMDFFPEFRDFLNQTFAPDTRTEYFYFLDATISYFRIKGR